MTPDRTTSATGPLATLDPDAGQVTTINLYTVDPARVDEVLEYLVRSAREVVRFVPGFISFNYHVSLDGTQVVNYGRWQSREAVLAARDNPAIATLMAETAEVAGPSKSVTYRLHKSVSAANG